MLVYFWATWCPVCRVMGGTIDGIARVAPPETAHGSTKDLVGALRGEGLAHDNGLHDLIAEPAGHVHGHLYGCLYLAQSASRLLAYGPKMKESLSYPIKGGRLHRAAPPRGLHSPRQRAERDALQAQGAGTAVKRLEKRVLACQGELTQAAPQFVPAEGVANAGVLLALPALLGEGLLSGAERIYAPLKAGFYGLQSILLCLVLMALLRIKNIERLSAHQPGELGLLLGLDRVPEVKTLRRKLGELGEQQRAAQRAADLTSQWTQDTPEALGVLYVDGHVHAYTGRKHPLPKTFVQQRRQCVPAATDVWVHNGAAEPLFFATSPINGHLLAVIDREVIPQARQHLGAERRLTLVFDREAWSPKAFRQWQGQGVDVITDRKGKQTPWDPPDFRPVTFMQGDAPVVYWLAERRVQVLPATRHAPAWWMREIRRLCPNGHQTAVMTTRQDLPAEVIAQGLFARWRQKNFFKYMQREFDIDHLST